MSKLIAVFTAVSVFFTSLLGISGSGQTVIAENNILLVQNLRYGISARETMDIAYPADATGDIDVILSVHGGGWTGGSKESIFSESKKAASCGYIGAALNYTYVSSDTHCDTILNEITMALQALRLDALKRGIRVRKYIITGISAGGHLATLYAYSRGSESGLIPAAVYNRCGPVIFDDIAVAEKMICENESLYSDAWCTVYSYLCGLKVTVDNLKSPFVKLALSHISATHYIKTAVPTIIVHGELDDLIPYENAVILDSMLTEYGVRHYFVSLPNSGHGIDNDPDKLQLAERYLYEFAADYLSSYSR